MTEHISMPEPRNEQRDEVRQEAAKYYHLAIEKRTPESSGSLQHILGNLALILDPSYYSLFVEHDPEMQTSVAENIAYIKRYFTLLDEFPDFRKSEEGTGQGYFPDLLKANHGSRALIDLYERSLRNPDITKTGSQPPIA